MREMISIYIKIVLWYNISLLLFTLLWILLIKVIYRNDQCHYTNSQSSSFVSKNLSSNEWMIDSRLKLNHFTLLGTHNSYHKESLFYKYQHSHLDVQLTTGIRQVELDIHLMGNNHVVYHLQFIDDKTNCYCFSDCLTRIFNWHGQNPQHYPIFLFIEIKQMFYEDFLTAFYGGVQCQHFESIKEQILQVFSMDSFILPEQIQGNQSSIRLALKQQKQDELNGDYTYKNYGWPPVHTSFGKILVSFIDDKHNIVIDLFSKCKPLSDFFFTTQSNINHPYASIIHIQNPLDKKHLIIQSQMNGQITRTLVGYGHEHLFARYRQARKSGIHIISTDSVQCNHTELCRNVNNDFSLSSPILCNGVTAPSFCNSKHFLQKGNQ